MQSFHENYNFSRKALAVVVILNYAFKSVSIDSKTKKLLFFTNLRIIWIVSILITWDFLKLYMFLVTSF